MLFIYFLLFFFFNDTATTEIYTLSLHDALPILSEEEMVAGLSSVHPDDQLWVRPKWREAATAAREWDAEFRVVRPTGEMRWVSVHASPLSADGEVTGFLGSMLDITERKLAEERTGIVVNRIAEAVSIVGPDGTHLHVNEAGQAILEDLRARHHQGPLGEQPW